MCAFRHRKRIQSRLPFPRVASSNPEVGAKPSRQEPDGPASPSIFRGSHFCHVAFLSSPFVSSWKTRAMSVWFVVTQWLAPNICSKILVTCMGDGTSILCFLNRGFLSPLLFPRKHFCKFLVVVEVASSWDLPGHIGRQDHTLSSPLWVGGIVWPGLAHEARREVMCATSWMRHLSGYITSKLSAMTLGFMC